jgi:hypothetical protein
MTNSVRESNHKIKELTPKEEVMGWLLLTMLYSPQLLDKKKSVLAEIGSITRGATKKLEALGCKRGALITAAIIGTRARDFYPPFDAEKLRNIAADIRSAVREMNEIVPQVLVPHGQIQKDGSLEIDMNPAGGDMQLEPWVQQSLLDKASLFEKLAAMCAAKEVPSRAEFGRIGHIWPLVYVEATTGRPHYALVARLLQETGVDVDMTGRRLREAYVSVKESHFATLRWLRLATVHLETVEAEGKLVIFAHSYDQNESAEHTTTGGEDRV